MKLLFIFHTTALYEAVDKENIEIVKQLLSFKRIDPNIQYILIYNFNKIYNYFKVKFKTP